MKKFLNELKAQGIVIFSPQMGWSWVAGKGEAYQKMVKAIAKTPEEYALSTVKQVKKTF